MSPRGFTWLVLLLCSLLKVRGVTGAGFIDGLCYPRLLNQRLYERGCTVIHHKALFLERLGRGPAVLVLVVSTEGSVPREAGTWMAVFADAIVGTMPNLGAHVENVTGRRLHTFCIPMGVDVEAIDAAMKLGAHHPMGPLELADFIGLDTCLSIMQVLHEGLADSKYRPCPLLVKYVEAGWLGRKTQRGFYDYRGDKPIPTR